VIERFIAGAWYGDAWPNGPYVYQIEKQPLQTNHGSVPLPEREAVGLEFITIDKSGKFAGLAHDLPGRICEWDNGWKDRNELFISGRCGYVNGELHDEGPAGVGYITDAGLPFPFVISHEPQNDLSQWTVTADLQIGQHHELGGVVVWCFTDSTHRVIDTGPCNEIKVHRDGEQVAVTYRKDGAGVYTRVYTLDELRNLPVFINSEQPPIVNKPPAPPTPIPEPTPMPVPNQLPVVQRVRAKYPTPLGAQHPAFLIEVANATGAKLLRKDGGTHVTLPNNVNVSQDILMFGDQGVDILGDGEGAATPGWIEKGTIAGEYIDVSGMGAPQPEPKPEPTPVPSVDLSAVLARLDKLEAKVEALRDDHDLLANGAVDLHVRVEALEQKPAPIYRAKGSTSRVWGHAHDINVTLEPQQ